MMLRLIVGTMLLCALATHARAAALGVATIVDGHAFVLRGAERYSFTEGTRLDPYDIVESNNASLVHIEFFGGGSLRLGPQSRLLFGDDHRAAYLLTGWAKISSGEQGFALRTPFGELRSRGDSVIDVRDATLRLFVETGSAELTAESQPIVRAAAGRFVSFDAHATPEVQPRPPQRFIGEMPPALRDRLPLLLAKLRDADTAPIRALDFNYEDVAAWLQRPDAAIRERLAHRWSTRLADADFRRAVQKHLDAHPEWRPLLRTPVAQSRR